MLENSQEQCACDGVLVLSLLNSGVNLIFLRVSSSLIIRFVVAAVARTLSFNFTMSWFEGFGNYQL